MVIIKRYIKLMLVVSIILLLVACEKNTKYENRNDIQVSKVPDIITQDFATLIPTSNPTPTLQLENNSSKEETQDIAKGIPNHEMDNVITQSPISDDKSADSTLKLPTQIPTSILTEEELRDDTYIRLDESHFPDEHFLLFVSQYDVDSDGYLSLEERLEFTEYDDSEAWYPDDYDPAKLEHGAWENIYLAKSLKGIEYFPELEKVCIVGWWVGSLSELVISSESLKYLNVHVENVTTINLNGCPNILELELQGEYKGTKLEIDQLKQLESLSIEGKEIYNLKLDSFNKLSSLTMRGVICPKIDFTSLKSLKYLVLGGDVENVDLHDMNNIAGVVIDDNSTLQSLDLTGCDNLYRLSIDQYPHNTFDASQYKCLKILTVSGQNVNHINISENNALVKLDCSNTNVERLDLCNNTLLEELWCVNTPISDLDLSNNTMLKKLYCHNTNIENLDVSKNTKLKTISCSDTRISELDLNNCNELIMLHCSENLTIISDRKIPTIFRY